MEMDITQEELVLLERILKGVQAPLISAETETLRGLYFKVKELHDDMCQKGKMG